MPPSPTPPLVNVYLNRRLAHFDSMVIDLAFKLREDRRDHPVEIPVHDQDGWDFIPYNVPCTRGPPLDDGEEDSWWYNPYLAFAPDAPVYRRLYRPPPRVPTPPPPSPVGWGDIFPTAAIRAPAPR